MASKEINTVNPGDITPGHSFFMVNRKMSVTYKQRTKMNSDNKTCVVVDTDEHNRLKFMRVFSLSKPSHITVNNALPPVRR